MKKITIVLIVLSLLFLIFAGAGCAGSSSGNKQYDKETASTTAAGSKNDSGAPNPTGGAAAAERKMIRNSALDLEAKDVVAAYEALLAYAEQYGGYEVYRNQQRSSGYLSIDAQIKIKPEHLDAFIAYAATQADVINTSITSEDITESYYDAQTRLKTMEEALETYYTFLKNAKTIEESLAVQNQINQLTLEIESLKGKIKLWDSLLAESVVTIRLRQIDDPVKIKKEINWSALTFEDMAYLMKSGLAGVVNVLVGIFQWLAIVLVAAAPVWIIAIVVIIIVRRRIKKRRQKKAVQPQAPPHDQSQNPQPPYNP